MSEDRDKCRYCGKEWLSSWQNIYWIRSHGRVQCADAYMCRKRCHRQIARLEQELSDSRMESEQWTDLLNDAREELERTQHQRDGLQQKLAEAEHCIQQMENDQACLPEDVSVTEYVTRLSKELEQARAEKEILEDKLVQLSTALFPFVPRRVLKKIQVALSAPKPEGGTEEVK